MLKLTKLTRNGLYVNSLISHFNLRILFFICLAIVLILYASENEYRFIPHFQFPIFYFIDTQFLFYNCNKFHIIYFAELMDQIMVQFVSQIMVQFVGQIMVQFVGQIMVQFVGQIMVQFVGQIMVQFVGQIMVQFVTQITKGTNNSAAQSSTEQSFEGLSEGMKG